MKKFDTINVIPFIDIMLVLLAIVLTTATFVTRGELDVVLPASSEATPADGRDAIEIAVDRDERLFLDGEEIALEALGRTLDDVAADTRIVLAVDERAPFERFVALVDVLKARGLDDVSVRTRTGAPAGP